MIAETCQFLYYHATYIWDKIGFSRRKGLRISETTITEGFVFDLWQYAERQKLGIEIYEATSERANGNDVEVFVELNNEYISLPCQAKIMDKSGRYAKIGHRVGAELQIDLLIDYAKKEGAIPGYLLYNHETDKHALAVLKLHRPDDLSHWGISWTPAMTIEDIYFYRTKTGSKKVKKLPVFASIHPSIGSPFADFVCQLLHDPEPWKTELLDYGKKNGYEVILKSASSVRRGNDWEPWSPGAKIGYITQANLGREMDLRAKQPAGFRPKYRILFSLERRQSAIYSVS